MADLPDNSSSTPTPDPVSHGLVVAAMGLLIVTLLYVILLELKTILRPLLIAVFICYLIVPAHRWLVRRGVPSWLSYCLMVGGFLGAMYGCGSMAAGSIRDISGNLEQYVTDLDSFVHRISDKVTGRFAGILGEDEPSSTGAEAQADAVAAGDADPDAATATQPATETAESEKSTDPWGFISLGRVTSAAQATLETFFGFFTTMMVVVFYMVFLLAEIAGFETRMRNAFGHQRAERAMDVIRKINLAISRYIAIKTLVSLLVGVISFVILTIFGVQYALLWALLTFLANYIPYVGSMAAVTLPVGMSFVQFSDELWKPVVLLVLLVGGQTLVGNVLEPRMVGQRLGVSPLIIMLSLAFFGMLWGIPGMILSAPLAVAIKIVLEHIDQTKPIARLCSTV